MGGRDTLANSRQAEGPGYPRAFRITVRPGRL
jgi:hypothetical protein